MYVLRGDSLTFVLNKDGLYKIGRTSGDIVIKNPSISRKHAEIKLRNDEALLRDCNSKYFTKYKGKILLVNEEVKLEDGDQITFGELTFNFQREDKIVTCATGLKDSEEDLATVIEELGGTYLKDWSKACTHLTTNEILISIKFLHAIMDNKRIVTPQYWKTYLENIKNNKLPPDPSQFYPPLGESMINSKHLEYNRSREGIFKGKTFGFWTKKRQMRMQDIITKAGGKSILLAKNISDENQLLKLMDNCIVMDPEDPSIERKFSKVFTAYKNKGRRLIPIQELVFSILQCSCEENCNPNFNRTKMVFSKESQKKYTAQAVVQETEETEHDVEHKQYSEVIPASFEEPQVVSASFEEPLEISTVTKTQMIGDETQPAKRIKLDPDIEILDSDMGKASNENVMPDTIKLESDIEIIEIGSRTSAGTKVLDNQKSASVFKRPNKDVTVPHAKKFKRESTSSKSNPFSLLSSDVSKENPYTSMVKEEKDVEQSHNLFKQKNLQIQEDDTDDSGVIIVEEKESSIGKNHSKTKKHMSAGYSRDLIDSKRKMSTQVTNDFEKTTKLKKKNEKGIVEPPVNFSSLKHDISDGTWHDITIKEEQKPTNINLDDKEREWCERFNNSVSIVVKDLLRKSKENDEIDLDPIRYSSNTKNFKKFRKSFVPKSTKIIQCTRSDHTGSNIGVEYGCSDDEDNRNM